MADGLHSDQIALFVARRLLPPDRWCLPFSALGFGLWAVAAELQCVLKCASDLYTPCESAEA